MSDGAPHPWNQEQWDRLARCQEDLPHALLLAGPGGLGKEAFAMELARLRLCGDPQNREPCGGCQNCRLFAAGTHPDLHAIQPEEAVVPEDTPMARYSSRYLEKRPKESKTRSTVIGVDQIRALIEAVQTRSHIAAGKAIILSPANAMTANAANSLLKLLEEPPAETLLLLVSARPSELPATIRSRCARIDFGIPDSSLARGWLVSQGIKGGDPGLLLELVGGAPLGALAAAMTGFLDQRQRMIRDLETLAGDDGDPVDSAACWREMGAERSLFWMQGWIIDIIRTGMSPNPPHLFNTDLKKRLQLFAERLNFNSLYTLLETVSKVRSVLGGSLDESLLLEDILIQWMMANQTQKNG